MWCKTHEQTFDHHSNNGPVDDDTLSSTAPDERLSWRSAFRFKHMKANNNASGIMIDTMTDLFASRPQFARVNDHR